MIFNCYFWNVKGLESPNRKYIAKIFLNSERKKDVVLSEEVKSTYFTLETNLKFIWK